MSGQHSTLHTPPIARDLKTTYHCPFLISCVFLFATNKVVLLPLRSCWKKATKTNICAILLERRHYTHTHYFASFSLGILKGVVLVMGSAHLIQDCRFALFPATQEIYIPEKLSSVQDLDFSYFDFLRKSGLVKMAH